MVKEGATISLLTLHTIILVSTKLQKFGYRKEIEGISLKYINFWGSRSVICKDLKQTKVGTRLALSSHYIRAVLTELYFAAPNGTLGVSTSIFSIINIITPDFKVQ